MFFCKANQCNCPIQKHPGSLLEGFTQTQVSTLAVKDRLLVAGGFQGELICKVSWLTFLNRSLLDGKGIRELLTIGAIVAFPLWLQSLGVLATGLEG